MVAILMPPLANTYAAYPISMLFTAGTMMVYSLFFGWERTSELRQLDGTGWLQTSRMQIQDLVHAQQVAQPQRDEVSYVLPTVLGIIVVATGIVLSFVVFW